MMCQLVLGALLGTQSNRDVSIVNSFELVYETTGDDVEMSDQPTLSSSSVSSRKNKIKVEFLEQRKEQCEPLHLRVTTWRDAYGESKSSKSSRLWTLSAGIR